MSWTECSDQNVIKWPQIEVLKYKRLVILRVGSPSGNQFVNDNRTRIYVVE